MSKRNKSVKHKAEKVDLPEFDHRAYLKENFGKKKKTTQKKSKIGTYFFLIILVLGIMIGSGVFSPDNTNKVDTTPYDIPETEVQTLNNGALLQVTVIASTTCSCCHQFVAYIENNGFEVDFIRDDTRIEQIKDDLKIPANLRSCHTTLIGDLFVEGHIPARNIYNFIDSPNGYDGITLPGMPAGSPGMGGEKDGVWEITGLIDGVDSGIYASV